MKIPHNIVTFTLPVKSLDKPIYSFFFFFTVYLMYILYETYQWPIYAQSSTIKIIVSI